MCMEQYGDHAYWCWGVKDLGIFKNFFFGALRDSLNLVPSTLHLENSIHTQTADRKPRLHNIFLQKLVHKSTNYTNNRKCVV